uniref:Peptidase S1 domain-containing protein n=1 Tax=Anopheles christyi TaxID=43041 RepID=A0A182K6F7_9DIPT
MNLTGNGDRGFMAYMENEVNKNQAMMPNVRESLDDCHLRYYKHSILESSYPTFERLHLKSSEFPHHALIGWTDSDGTVKWNCIGTLVWENFILTSARCTENENSVAPAVVRLGNSDTMQQIKIAEAIRHPEYREGNRQHAIALLRLESKVEKRATFVMYMGNERNTVVKHYNHPGYREGQYYNDIGLLKVKDRFVFFGSFVPFCIWHDTALPESIIELTGHGRRDLNHFSLHNESVDVFEPQNFQLTARADVLPLDNCSYPVEFSKNVSRGLTEEHLCFGNEPYLVPQTCQQALGGPIGGKVDKFNKQYRYAFALNSFGRDCGFGHAAVGVRLSTHIDWLRSVLLPDYRKDSGSVHFLNSDLEENDTCRHVDGTEGLCVDVARCPKIRYDFGANRQVIFCQTSTVICCPYENMVNETSVYGRELDECEDRYQVNRARANEKVFETGPVGEDFPHLVVIEWHENRNVKADRSCRGTLISSKAVLTSAKCLQQRANKPLVVKLGMSEAAPVLSVEDTVVHPEFDGVSGKNDVAVVKLKEPIDQTSTVKYPACLWTNQTHTPFEMIQLVINETTDTYVYPTAMYHADCAALEVGLATNQLCVDVQPPNTVVSVGDPMFWSEMLDDGSRVQYLVGIMSHTAANGRLVIVHSRISSYVGWIKNCHFRYYKYGKYSIIKPAFGQPTYLREFAHMAAIGWTQPDNTIKWNCGGSLIWENYILTAAHCTEDHENNAPDVARFADLDLFNDTDNQYAQQLKIVEIIRHPEHKFRARYHDIALMRLEHNVLLHDTVAPACLWTDDEIRFKVLEATGWGDTGFAAAKTPILLKVALRPVDNEQCIQHYVNLRGLRDGLHANQLCAGDPRMDTCPGDSGGPLQVKLLHNTRETPFLVGVTSFGLACGLSVPGVYTRVAPYVPWIMSVLKDRGEAVTEWKFQPQACALRYAQYREFEPRVVLDKSDDMEQVDLSEAHLFQTASRQLATIHWDGMENASTPHDCFGVIIDESTIVTLARCARQNGKPPSHVSYQGTAANAVIRSYIHPNWREGSLFGDIGLLKLKESLDFSAEFQPACIWERTDLPEPEFFVSGRGLLELNLIDVEDEPLETGAVPGTCQQSPGGPLEREIMRSGRSLMYVYALNLYGRDCGYGESALGVRLAYHLSWMDSILFPKQIDEDATEPFIFLNSDLDEGDTCTVYSGFDGVCTRAVNCPKMLYRYSQNQVVRFCSSGSVLCCPREDVRNETDAEWREIDSCEVASRDEGKAFNPYHHMVTIVLKGEELTQGCIGTMITSRTFLTAASCLDGNAVLEYVSLDNSEVPMIVLMAIEKVIVHPEYDSKTKRNNIALVRAVNRTETSFGKTPACLWGNNTHTPFHLNQIGLTEEQMLGAALAFTKFNSDCRRTFGRPLTDGELCVDVEYPSDTEKIVVDEGTPAYWIGRGTFNYLVGIASHAAPNDSSVFLHTRIAPYVGWIKSVL